MDKKKDKKTEKCLKCKGIIVKDKDLYVLVATFKGKINKENAYFHMTCWEEYFKDCVKRKVDSLFGQVTQNFGRVLRQAKEQGVI